MDGLLQPHPVLFIHHQAIEDCQHLFAVTVHPLQVLTERFLEIAGFEPLVQHGTRNVNILP